jgi:thioester reductase-like protein
LVKDLLEKTRSEIYCLVRAEDAARGRHRLKSILAIYDPEGSLQEAFDSRVHPVLGDVSRDNLGLTPEQWNSLAERVDTTVHVAALTNLFTSYRRIQPINLGGTRNIIKFCLRTRHKYLCHVSTHTVMGDKTFDKSVVFRESDLDIGQGFDHMSYQQTKFEAEKLIREAEKDGLIWNIMRPGQIFGDAETGLYPHGQANITGLFYDIFKTVTETGVALFSQTHFDVTPVDYVSHGILELGLRRNQYFETYHLTNPDTKTYSEVIGLVAQLGYPIRVVSQTEYRRLLFERELCVEGVEYKSPTTSAFRWWFKREIDFSHSAVTNCDYTQRMLQAANIFCPETDTTLLGKYFDAGLRNGYFTRAPGKFKTNAKHAIDVGEAETELANAESKEEVPL